MAEGYLTEYGFTWGAAEVTRLFEIDGRVSFQVTTEAGRRIEIYVSPKGQRIRVFNKETRRELTES